MPRYVSALYALLLGGVALTPTGAAEIRPSLYLREMDLMSGELLAKLRQNCAAGQMPQILRKVQKDNPGETLPAPDVHCLRALAVSAKRNALMDLYINIALQEQGYSELSVAQQAKLLAHDEAGRTAGRIFRAAGSGATSYESITGKPRNLSCPLALDAGYTWGYRNPDKRQPYELTPSEAAAVARACYGSATPSITVKGQPVAATTAGLYAGAWLGRQQARTAN